MKVILPSNIRVYKISHFFIIWWHCQEDSLAGYLRGYSLSVKWILHYFCLYQTHPAEANNLTPKGSLQMLTFEISLLNSGFCGSWAMHELRGLYPPYQFWDIWDTSMEPFNQKYASNANMSNQLFCVWRRKESRFCCCCLVKSIFNLYSP